MNGLKNTLEKALGFSDVLDKGSILSAKPTLVGGRTDGASVNIRQHKNIKERRCFGHGAMHIG